MQRKSKTAGSAQVGTAGGFVAVIVLWLLRDGAGVEMPPNVGEALTALITMGAGALGAWIRERREP